MLHTRMPHHIMLHMITPHHKDFTHTPTTSHEIAHTCAMLCHATHAMSHDATHAHTMSHECEHTLNAWHVMLHMLVTCYNMLHMCHIMCSMCQVACHMLTFSILLSPHDLLSMKRTCEPFAATPLRSHSSSLDSKWCCTNACHVT